MPDAWMVRSMQRQNLLSEMHTKIIQLEDERDDPRNVQRKLIDVCIGFLEREPELSRAWEIGLDREKQLFFQDLLPAIKAFSRAEEEVNVLVSELLTWLVQSFVHEFHAALTSKEIHDPKTIFNADSATQSVKLEQ